MLDPLEFSSFQPYCITEGPFILIRGSEISPQGPHIVMLPFDDEEEAGFRFRPVLDDGSRGQWPTTPISLLFFRGTKKLHTKRSIPRALLPPRGTDFSVPQIYVRGELVLHVTPLLTLYISAASITLGFHDGEPRYPSLEVELPMTAENLRVILLGTAKLGQICSNTLRGVKSALSAFPSNWGRLPQF